MARFRKRWFGNKKFDSKWEKTLHEGLLKNADYHTKDHVSYSIPKTYKPDFIVRRSDGDIYVEAKGRFRDRDEARKYIFIKECVDRFVFLFMDPDKPMPFAKKRKDGTKQSHAQWAEKQGIEWFTEETFPKEWR